MHYWNQSNFEGLERLADELASLPGLQALADYARARSQGRRREAFAALDGFLRNAPPPESLPARELSLLILTLHGQTREAHQFLAQPLLSRFLLPALRAWADSEPTAHAPLHWLGLLQNDGDLLRRALSACPDDVAVRCRLIDFALGAADYATHHLNEGFFIGEPAGARQALELAAQLIAEAPQTSPFSRHSDEVAQLSALLDDWQAYSDHPEGSFADWCAARQRPYAWAKKYYYSQT
ncbi:hypothetical protein NK553_02470 [Pseudomonas sp. ZM23]|uniref:DUF4034 domain-containing protein n=1 Tax=Pseudomonas triclosanedens TaxID=2961893 RepID=A0ABY6ZYS1_9PSED|nr:hypothetical protein [Pseudomonas triclosanedens]MCP8462806.1 hypothetical protein [Pseudomonas triclosanedens]MCP8468426.1 hypothetical protein [Pseudomonas triclosanedens]MCP8475147.1 hypothetical protein [Pseudomonas triclosanedens]WAI49988.1 hypothetical protein OU419_01595 [Pseudomonas triclosanedens]